MIVATKPAAWLAQVEDAATNDPATGALKIGDFVWAVMDHLRQRPALLNGLARRLNVTRCGQFRCLMVATAVKRHLCGADLYDAIRA